MSNPIEEIGHDLKVAGVKVAHVAEQVFHVGGAVLRVLKTANKVAPQFKQELSTLIADLEPIAVSLAPVLATKGTNVVADLAVIQPVMADLKKAAADFNAFLPTLKAALAELKEDVQGY